MNEEAPGPPPPPVGDGWTVGPGSDDPTAAAAGASSSPRPFRWMVATALSVLAAVVVSLVLADVAGERDTLEQRLADVAGERDTLEERLADRRQVARVAGDLTTALFTVDGGNLEATRERVLALSTGRLEAEFDEFVTGAVGSAFAELGATSTITVSDVFVGDVDDETARAVVVMDQTVDRGEGPEQYYDRYLVLTLVRTSGGWKVDGVLTVSGSEQPIAGTGAPPG